MLPKQQARPDRYYLSGPMTGVEEHNFPLFNKIARELRHKGLEVVNPAEHPPQQSWEDYLRYDIRLLIDCNFIVLLPGWEGSRGAKLEYHVAAGLGLKVVDSDLNPLEIYSHSATPNLAARYSTAHSSASSAPSIDSSLHSASRVNPSVTSPLNPWQKSEENILDEAQRLVSGDRNRQYGEPWEDYARVAAFWSQIAGKILTPKQCILMMVALKLARLCNQFKRDSLVDLAGYCRCLEKVLDHESGSTGSTDSTD